MNQPRRHWRSTLYILSTYHVTVDGAAEFVVVEVIYFQTTYILKLFLYSSNPQKLKEAVKAARSLEKALDLSGVDERLLKLAAVQDQVKLCEKRRDKFSKSITRYLNNLFIHVGNDTDNLADMSAPSVRLFLKFILNIRRYFISFSIWRVAY